VKFLGFALMLHMDGSDYEFCKEQKLTQNGVFSRFDTTLLTQIERF